MNERSSSFGLVNPGGKGSDLGIEVPGITVCRRKNVPENS